MSSKTEYGEPIVTPVVRLQFVNLKEVDSGHKNSSGKYSVRALIKKSKKDDLNKLLEAVAEVYPGEDLEELEKHPLLDKKGRLRDGDNPKNAKFEGHEGHYFFNTFSENQPDTYLINDDGEAVECEPGEIFAGCYAQLCLQPAYLEEYDTVTFYLQGVMKTKDGERFSSGRTDTKALLSNWSGKGSPVASTTKKGKAVADDDEDEKPAKKKKAAPVEDDEDEDEKPVKKKSKAFDRDQSDDDDEDEKPKKRAKKPVEDEDDDDEDEKPVKKKKAAPVDDDEDSDDDEDEKPAKKKPLKKKGQGISDLLNEDDD